MTPQSPHLGPLGSRPGIPAPEPQHACTWTSTAPGETAGIPCTSHEDGQHVFADGHRLPLAVTGIAGEDRLTRPSRPPVAGLDVEEVLARHGLGQRIDGAEG